jgi:adenosine kinase
VAIASNLASTPKTNPSRPRVVVITSGPDSTILLSSASLAAEQDSPALIVPVAKIADSELVDTNGAGDAFAGGFIGAYLSQLKEGGENVDLKKCVEVGHRLGRMCVKQVRASCSRENIALTIQPKQIGPQWEWPKVDILNATD